MLPSLSTFNTFNIKKLFIFCNCVKMNMSLDKKLQYVYSVLILYKHFLSKFNTCIYNYRKSQYHKLAIQDGGRHPNLNINFHFFLFQTKNLAKILSVFVSDALSLSYAKQSKNASKSKQLRRLPLYVTRYHHKHDLFIFQKKNKYM